MDLKFCHLVHQSVFKLLKEMSPQFIPSLEDSLNIEVYAEKLSNNATFLICNSNGKTIGTIVFYPNHTSSILYIPLVWVDKNFRGVGVARQMFKTLIEYGKDEGLVYIDLEVLKSNVPATNLYSSLGFYQLEDRNMKFLMRLDLNSVNEKS